MFALLLLSFVSLRLIQAACAVGSFNWEEGFTLSAAWELLNHDIWPMAAYQITDFEHGSLVMVLVTTPFCYLLGPSILALKLPAVLIGCLTMLGLYLLARDVFGHGAALLTTLLYLAAPSPIYAFNLTNHGFHPDAVPLVLFFIWGLWRCTRDRRGALAFLGAGVLGGCAVFFAYISAIPVVSILLAWVWSGGLRAARWRSRLTLATGLLLGACPILLYNVAVGFRGFRNLWTSALISPEVPRSYIQRLSESVGDNLEVLRNFSSTTRMLMEGRQHLPHEPTFDLLFWIAALSALAAPWVLSRVWPQRSAPLAAGPTFLDRAVLLVLGLTAVVILALAYSIFPKHLVLLLVLLLLPLGARLAALWRGPQQWKRAAVVLAVAPYLAYGGLVNSADIRPDLLGVSLYLDGRCEMIFLERAQQFTDRAPERMRYLDAVYAGVKDPPFGLNSRHDFRRERVTAAVQQLIHYHSMAGAARARPLLLELGYLAESAAINEVRKIKDLDQPLRQQMLRQLSLGYGRSVYFYQLVNRDLFSRRLAWAPRALLPLIVQGLGYGTARRMVRPVPARFVEHHIPGHLRPHFWRGVRQFEASPGGSSLSMNRRKWLDWTKPF